MESLALVPRFGSELAVVCPSGQLKDMAARTLLPKLQHWLHVLCTPLLTFFSVQRLRGKAAIQAIGIIPQFTGWLMHDFLASYLSFENCLHTFCKSHLMRELIFLFEQHQQAWAKDLHDLFLEMLQCVQERKARDAPLSLAECDRWSERYWDLLRAGRRANPLTPEQKARKRRKQSKEQNLLDRLEAYDTCYALGIRVDSPDFYGRTGALIWTDDPLPAGHSAVSLAEVQQDMAWDS